MKSKASVRKNRYVNLLNLDESKDRKTTVQPTPHTSAFKAVPEAGVFTEKDLKNLEKGWEKSNELRNLRESKEWDYEITVDSNRETLSNTTRYRQIPGTSTLQAVKKSR